MTRTTWLAGVCAVLMTVLSFFGTNALFGPLQLASGLCLLAVIGLLLAGAFSGVRGLLAGQGPRVLLRALGTCLLLAVVLAVQPTVHELGLRSLIALQRGALATAAQEALATAKDDGNLWRLAFEIWPALLGPTRAAAWREGELLFLDFEGSPGPRRRALLQPAASPAQGLQHAAGRLLVPIPLVKKPWRPQRTRACRRGQVLISPG